MKFNLFKIFKRKEKINPRLVDYERGFILHIDDNIDNKEYFKNLENENNTRT